MVGGWRACESDATNRSSSARLRSSGGRCASASRSSSLPLDTGEEWPTPDDSSTNASSLFASGEAEEIAIS